MKKIFHMENMFCFFFRSDGYRALKFLVAFGNHMQLNVSGCHGDIVT